MHEREIDCTFYLWRVGAFLQLNSYLFCRGLKNDYNACMSFVDCKINQWIYPWFFLSQTCIAVTEQKTACVGPPVNLSSRRKCRNMIVWKACRKPAPCRPQRQVHLRPLWLSERDEDARRHYLVKRKS